MPKGIPIDHAGQRFGRLTVLGRAPGRYSTGAVCWLCRCDCGTEKVVAGQSLRAGLSRSCGCLRRETTAARNRARAAARHCQACETIPG